MNPTTSLSTPEHTVYNSVNEIPFKQESLLGRGAYGIVDLVRGTSGPYSGQVYARKTFILRGASSENWRRDSFQKEVAIIKKLRHSHIASLITTYTYKREYVMIMSPVADSSLEEHFELIQSPNDIRNGERNKMLKWFGCLANGLAYLHQQGIRHRDIKPSNILVKGYDVFFTDFGTSFHDEEDTVMTETITRGTLKYNAPEAVDYKRCGRSADIFALGAVYLEMLSVYSGGCDLLRQLNTNVKCRYASNMAAVVQWVNTLGCIDHNPKWYPTILSLCRSMLAAEQDLRPTAKGLTACWAYQKFANIPYILCKCITHVSSATQINGAIIEASREGHYLALKILLNNRAGVGWKNTPYEWTALHCAAWHGHRPVLEILLENGADIRAQTTNGWTALHAAAWRGHGRVVQILLDKGADPSARKGDGGTALHAAVWGNNYSVVRHLLMSMSQTEIDAKNKLEETALDIIIRKRGNDTMLQLWNRTIARSQMSTPPTHAMPPQLRLESKEEIIKKVWGTRANFQATNGLKFTPEDLEEGDLMLEAILRFDFVSVPGRG